MADYSMANRKIAYTLGRGRAYIFDMSSTSGYMGEKYFQEFGPRFFDMSSASGYMGEKYFQEFGPRFLGAYPLAHTPLREVSKERGSCTWPCNLPRMSARFLSLLNKCGISMGGWPRETVFAIFFL